MTTNTMKYVVFALIGLAGSYSIYTNTYTKFKPVVFENDLYKHLEVENDSIFTTNLKIVLDYNDVKYEIDEDNAVLVKRKIYHDKELVLNYTKKAMDTAWINSHSKHAREN